MSPNVLGMIAVSVAFLELDGAAAGQFMISRPIVFGPFLGACFGDIGLGAALGALYELFCLDDLPVGGHLPINATAAAGAGFILSMGDAPIPVELAFPGGLFFGWLHRQVESWLRLRRDRLGRLVEQRVGRQQSLHLRRLMGIELAKQASVTLGLMAVAVGIRMSLPPAWSFIPESLRFGLQAAFLTAPWIGLAALWRALRL